MTTDRTDRARDIAHIGHAELLTPAPEASLAYFTDLLGLTVVAQAGSSVYLRGHGDYRQRRGRLHHLAFWVDSREDVLRAADLMNDACVPIEAGPSRHIPVQGFYLYTREPGGNRIEICSGGYLGFDPDDEPVVWTTAEYAAKPGWGARLPSTFRSYGTPGTGAAEESVTTDWPSPAGLATSPPGPSAPATPAPSPRPGQ
jgi:catechol 2,3-dioxygenase-like lactoylglutathione lyase family enzyme